MFWLCEYNWLVWVIGRDYLDWDDDWVFEMVCSIVIVQFIKVVVEDYINYIVLVVVKLMVDFLVVWKVFWNKFNWIIIEFSFFYWWYVLILDEFIWGG